jgi:hypothetical protein
VRSAVAAAITAAIVTAAAANDDQNKYDPKTRVSAKEIVTAHI